MDRRQGNPKVGLPVRAKPMRLDILVEAMGRVNFGEGLHDRKGLRGPVKLGDAELSGWQVFNLPLDGAMLGKLKFGPGKSAGPAFWRATATIGRPGDTFLDLRSWGKGVVWLNGHCLGRFWNIGPTQTAYVPGPWLKPGKNEIVVFDLVGPQTPVLAGLEKPILDELRPALDFASGGQMPETQGK